MNFLKFTPVIWAKIGNENVFYGLLIQGVWNWLPGVDVNVLFVVLAAVDYQEVFVVGFHHFPVACRSEACGNFTERVANVFWDFGFVFFQIRHKFILVLEIKFWARNRFLLKKSARSIGFLMRGDELISNNNKLLANTSLDFLLIPALLHLYS